MQRNAFLSFALGIAFCGCTTPTPGQFSSDYLEKGVGGLTVWPEVGLALLETLTNRTREPVWVRVTFEAPAPNRPGKVVQRLGPGATGNFIHPQVSMVTGVDYLITIETYRDAALTQLVERAENKFRYSEKQRAVFEKFAKEYGG